MELKNINYKINNKVILSDITTKFENNAVNLIIGPNGSGKSTLLNILYQITKQTSGELINNKEKTSYLGQYNSIFHKVNLEYFLKLNRYLKTNTLEIDNYTNWIIELFSLKNFLKQSLISLSGGERQRAILASIFLLEKEYILLDEPFSYLDISAKLQLSNILENNFKNKTIIIVTHNFNIFKNIKKTIALKNGKIFFDGNKPNNEIMEKLFDIEGSNYFTGR